MRPFVHISVFGKFQAFRLAVQLERLDALRCLYTSYPERLPIRRSHVANVWAVYTGFAVLQRVLPGAAWSGPLYERLSQLYDMWVAREILDRSADRIGHVFHGWAGHSTLTLQRAKRHGVPSFVDSACPHFRFKQSLLTEEAERYGVRFGYSSLWQDRLTAEYETADFIVVPSDYSRRSFLSEGIATERLVTVPLGVEVDEVQCSEGHADRWRPFRVLMVGTDPLRKGASYLLDAWERLRLPDATLVLRCELPQGTKTRWTFSDSIVRVPRVSRRDLLALYRSASVFCFPSIDDGFGMVVLEAMAHGLPVIVTENVGAADVVRQGIDGFVVPIRSPEHIAACLERLYRDRDLWHAMSENARQRAREFTWERYARRLLAEYQERRDRPLNEPRRPTPVGVAR